jgi:DNA-directed RNA polymerase specialized sigma24 family protein
MNKEHSQRLDVLYRKHNKWLRQVAYNISKDKEMTDELVSDLYLYLAENMSEKLYYKDGGVNLGYCNSFLKTRFINKIKANNKFSDKEINDDLLEGDSEEVYDDRLDILYSDVKLFLKQRQSSNGWVSAKIAEMYFFGKGFTIGSLAEELGVSRSTVFLHIKKMKKELREYIEHPYKEEDE